MIVSHNIGHNETWSLEMFEKCGYLSRGDEKKNKNKNLKAISRRCYLLVIDIENIVSMSLTILVCVRRLLQLP